MPFIISTEGIWRDFKSGNDVVHAVRNVSLSIEEGKLTILRGRSGSGKTTLINILGAIDTPTLGKVFFNGSEVTQMSDAKRDEFRRKNIGFVFQSGALLSNMTAYENVEFGLRIAGYDPKGRRQRAEECLDVVGLTGRIKHFPHELSGGEAQRVAIARAIAHRPRVIFADEPTAALDTNMGLQVVKTFKSLVESEGMTVVMTTHDPNMIEVADSVYTLQDGGIVADEW